MFWHGKRRVPAAVWVLALLACAAAAGADILVMKDGRKLEGAVTDKGDTYDVQTPQGLVSVKKTDVKEVQKGDAAGGGKPAGPASADDEKAAADLVAFAEQSIPKKNLAEARSALERVVKQYPNSSAAAKAKELLVTMPNGCGRLVLGFDNASEAKSEVLAGSGAQVEWVSDPKQVRLGAGAVHVVINAAKATLVMIPIPEQNLEKLKAVSFWMNSEAKLHQKRVMKFCLVSPSSTGALNFFDANIINADENGWKLVQVGRGQFKGEGGGFAANLQNGRPSWKKVVGIGFLLPPDNYRDFILDDVRFLE